MAVKPRVAVVSPFLDKQHGTERCVVEQLNRLANEYEIHVYSGRVADLDLGRIAWHRVPTIPGPHLLRYVWFFTANHLWRWSDRRLRKLAFDLVYSPGINCFDADLISVHVVFAEFSRKLKPDMKLSQNSVRSWPRLLHRRLSYRLFAMLEHRVYGRADLPLTVVSRKMAEDLDHCFGKRENVVLAYHGVDPRTFRPEVRERLRSQARRQLGFAEHDFVILLIGNDWNSKGLPCLMNAVARLQNPALKIAIVGQDDASPYSKGLDQRTLASQVSFLPFRADVEFYYAAADANVGPSRDDSFGLPPLEAMASGLPVIVSRQAGVSEAISEGDDGFILQDPQDSEKLASLIQRLYTDAELRTRLGSNAAKTATQYSWQANADRLRAIFETLLERRRKCRADEQKAIAANA
jgi:glycosyltransferase involved in cell wall biosynthesis